VKSLDPLKRPITIHPSRCAHETVDDPPVIDIDMLQTGHDDRKSVPNTIGTVNSSLAATAKMPIIVGEVCYEKIQEARREEVQRFMFWSCILSRTGRHTNGANGICQINTREAIWSLPSRPGLGRSKLGCCLQTSRLRADRSRQITAHALLLVEARAPA
jgi:hypothetical protein